MVFLCIFENAHGSARFVLLSSLSWMWHAAPHLPVVAADQEIKPDEADVELAELAKIKLKLDDYTDQTTRLKQYQELFEIPNPYTFPILSQVPRNARRNCVWSVGTKPLSGVFLSFQTLQVYDKRRQMWQLYLDWLNKTDQWYETDFLSNPDVEEMDKAVTQFYKQIYIIYKDERTDIAAKLKKSIEEFKVIMPMVVELGNKSRQVGPLGDHLQHLE